MKAAELNTLLEELDTIDSEAQRLALACLDGGHRPEWAADAQPLAERLTEIAATLKAVAPKARKERSPQISESTMDLEYTQGKTKFTSLRLGRRIKERQS